MKENYGMEIIEERNPKWMQVKERTQNYILLATLTSAFPTLSSWGLHYNCRKRSEIQCLENFKHVPFNFRILQ
jgi:hypothetical protein